MQMKTVIINLFLTMTKYLVMGSKYNKIGDKYIHTSNNYNSDSISDITIYNPSAFIEGRVLDENGDSIQGAIVRLLDSSNVEIERVTSDENGYYHFDMSSNHHYRVIATTDGMVEDISIDTGKDWEGNEKKDLYLKPHPTGQGTTVDENGNLFLMLIFLCMIMTGSITDYILK